MNRVICVQESDNHNNEESQCRDAEKSLGLIKTQKRFSFFFMFNCVLSSIKNCFHHCFFLSACLQKFNSNPSESTSSDDHVQSAARFPLHIIHDFNHQKSFRHCRCVPTQYSHYPALPRTTNHVTNLKIIWFTFLQISVHAIVFFYLFLILFQ